MIEMINVVVLKRKNTKLLPETALIGRLLAVLVISPVAYREAFAVILGLCLARYSAFSKSSLVMALLLHETGHKTRTDLSSAR